MPSAHEKALLRLTDGDTEKLVLGCALNEGDSAFDAIVGVVNSSDFAISEHKKIFGVLREIRDSGGRIDMASTAQRLGQKNGAGIGEHLPYLLSLVDGTPRLVDPAGVAQRLRTLRTKRDLYREAMLLQDRILEPEADVCELLAGFQQTITEATAVPGRRATEFSGSTETGTFRLELPAHTVTLSLDRLRRDQHELIAELTVHSVRGIISAGALNLSSVRARADRAKLLASRTAIKGIDWAAAIEELSLRTIEAERRGQPGVDLRTVSPPSPDDMIRVAGLVLPRRHPTILFGDGGSAKSLLGLWLSGLLVEQGIRVGFFDFELCGEDHRLRLERLFPDGMPAIFYVRCERALVHETDRLRRVVKDENIEYGIFDSISFACDGPPEAAETAATYLRAARQIGVGGLHVAHINKQEGSDKKPFGSTFWHNGARCTWFVKGDPDELSDSMDILLQNRKSNLNRLQPPVAYHITFGPQIIFRRTDPADTPALSAGLSVRHRMVFALRHGALTLAELAEEVDADVETVSRTVRRYKNLFCTLKGNRIGLTERGSE